MAETQFEYQKAFSRNLGWVTPEEAKVLSEKRVAIAGMGGVGGHYAEILARLGVTKFHIADFDEFEVQNFNRQNGSGISTLHRKKSEVIREKILDINPHAEIREFNNGVSATNIQEFMAGVDFYLDGLDFFVLDVRREIFSYTHSKKIPAVTVAPVGMGASLLVFDGSSMSFAEYFGMLDSDPNHIKALRFLIGLTPSMKQAKYLVDRSHSDFLNKKAPSLPMGPYLCAGVAASEVLKILLKRGEVKSAPWVLHFDAYLQTYTKSYVWMGHKNPLQKIKFKIVKKMLKLNS